MTTNTNVSSGRTKVFDLTTISEFWPLIEGTAGLEPRLAYQALADIHRADIAAFPRQGFTLGMQPADVMERFRAAAHVEGWSPEQAMDAHRAYYDATYLECLFLGLFGHQLRALVAMPGLDRLLRLIESGARVVLVPFHAGHFQVVVEVVAALGIEIAAVVAEQLDVYGPLARYWPPLAIKWVNTMHSNALIGAQRALRLGKVVSILPDIFVGGTGRPDTEVDFLGVRTRMSSGCSMLCRITQAVAVPLYLTGTGPDGYVLHIDEPVPPPSKGGEQEHLELLVRRHEQLLLPQPHEWRGWSNPLVPFVVGAAPAERQR